MLINPNRPTAEAQLRNAKEAASGVGRVAGANAGNKEEIDKAFATIAQEHIAVLFVSVDPLFIVNRVQVIDSAAGTPSLLCIFSVNLSIWVAS